jgi:hypothetical protein
MPLGFGRRRYYCPKPALESRKFKKQSYRNNSR